MIPSSTDPDTMSPDARLAEVAEILALGYLRLKTGRKESKELDMSRPPTAPWSGVVSGNGAENTRESA